MEVFEQSVSIRPDVLEDVRWLGRRYGSTHDQNTISEILSRYAWLIKEIARGGTLVRVRGNLRNKEEIEFETFSLPVFPSKADEYLPSVAHKIILLLCPEAVIRLQEIEDAMGSEDTSVSVATATRVIACLTRLPDQGYHFGFYNGSNLHVSKL